MKRIQLTRLHFVVVGMNRLIGKDVVDIHLRPVRGEDWEDERNDVVESHVKGAAHLIIPTTFEEARKISLGDIICVEPACFDGIEFGKARGIPVSD